jgi:hypothetical protein
MFIDLMSAENLLFELATFARNQSWQISIWDGMTYKG